MDGGCRLYLQQSVLRQVLLHSLRRCTWLQLSDRSVAAADRHGGNAQATDTSAGYTGAARFSAALIRLSALGSRLSALGSRLSAEAEADGRGQFLIFHDVQHWPGLAMHLELEDVGASVV